MCGCLEQGTAWLQTALGCTGDPTGTALPRKLPRPLPTPTFNPCPQLGLIRSLNVHVSGAIGMYEYTRQALQAAQGGAAVPQAGSS